MLHDITFREGISGHGGVRATSSSIVSAAVPATSWNPKAQVASIERAVGSRLPLYDYSSAPSTRSRKERRSAQGSSHQRFRFAKPASGIRDVAFSTQALALPLMTRQAPVPAFNSKPLPQHDSPPSPRTDERSPVERASRPGSLLGPSNMAATMADFGASPYGGGRASVEVAAKAKARGNGSLLAQRLQQAASAGGDSHEAGRRAWRAKTDLAQKV